MRGKSFSTKKMKRYLHLFKKKLVISGVIMLDH